MQIIIHMSCSYLLTHESGHLDCVITYIMILTLRVDAILCKKSHICKAENINLQRKQTFKQTKP